MGGEDEVEGKSPAKTKKSAKSFMPFGSAKKDKEKKQKDRDSREKDVTPSVVEPSNIANVSGINMSGNLGAVGTGSHKGLAPSVGLEVSDKYGGYANVTK